MAHLHDPGHLPAGHAAAVVAVKDLSRAKTRLTSLSPALRGRLAALMAVTVVRALTEALDRVVVVTTAPGIGPLLHDHGLPTEIIADPRAGLNAAFAEGAARLRADGADLVVACMADLPALTTDSVRRTLASCADRGRWFVPDAAGTGTTLLAARGLELDPRFGPGSAQHHAVSGATELDAPDGLRVDVDAPADLAAAAAVGLLPPVAALVDEGRIGRWDTGIVVGPEADGWAVLTSGGSRVRAEADALGADVVRLAAGQRVHLVRSPEGPIRHLWI
ncbi:2-phospho-L-lactate guanylyltransferase [Ammonicoccus fulvus]|uniref:2-phospho-L-lactate guanylyltransferase n=1 Tax=Ammonicoccus fulvus TaxID=3138240 RepID=A0ABZ3FRG2_9ACTN